ncbi:MAG: transcription antitermination factor NusB [Vicinamibacterales bacterium]
MSGAEAADSRWSGRRQARAAALQASYQCEVGGTTLPDAFAVLDASGEGESAALAPADRRFAEELAAGAQAARVELDERIGQAARHWRVERMAVLDRLVLRLAVHEWLTRPATPPRVVINEAIELARAYSGEEAARFVNGVLDGVLKGLRAEGRIAEPSGAEGER